MTIQGYGQDCTTTQGYKRNPAALPRHSLLIQNSSVSQPQRVCPACGSHGDTSCLEEAFVPLTSIPYDALVSSLQITSVELVFALNGNDAHNGFGFSDSARGSPPPEAATPPLFECSVVGGGT